MIEWITQDFGGSIDLFLPKRNFSLKIVESRNLMKKLFEFFWPYRKNAELIAQTRKN